MFIITAIRNFSISSNNMNKHREIKTLKKIMNGREKNKTKWYTSELPTVKEASSLSKTHGQGKQSSRRTSVLNKLFMKNVTDLMANGDISTQLIGYGIQISRVKVAPDFRNLNVYWLTTGTHMDDVIEKVLKKASGEIRHELSQLRLMGEVPKITFLKDRKNGSIAQVDNILLIADYGDDFVPTDSTLQLKNELKLQTNITEEIRAKISALDNQVFSNIDDETLPEMRHDVLGLNHMEIMQNVTQTLKKTKEAWKKYEVTEKSFKE